MCLSPQSTFAALEFTSLPMLGWLAAAILPWLIHRWFRRQRRTTSWAAIDLLMHAMRKRARQVQLQQWLLLAVRTAILMLVALAVADPLLRQWASASNNPTGIHRILVLDQSYSMEAMEQDGTRWSQLQRRAQEVLQASNSSAITLLAWSDKVENLMGRPTYDQAIALSALSELEPTPASADFATASRAVLSAIARAKQEFPLLAQHEVFFLTDMGDQTWTLDQMREQLMTEIAQEAEVEIINVASSGPGNVAISQLTVEPAIALVQTDLIIRAVVRCLGEPPTPNVRLELLVDGTIVAEQQVALSRDGDNAVEFTHRFVDAGLQTIELRCVDFHDALSIDNQRWLVTAVRAKLKVACFAGQRGATADLKRALAPFDPENVIRSDIAAEALPISRLGSSDLSHFDAIFLASVEELMPREVLALKRYTDRGGGLALLLGPGSTTKLGNSLSEILPVEVVSIQPQGHYGFDPLEYRHPILTPFRGQSQTGLKGVSISQYVKLQTVESHSSAAIVLAFDTGDPALVVDQSGLGRVAVLALPGALSARTADATPWSSFALSPSYLPVMRELINYLVQPAVTTQHNFVIGEPASIPTSLQELPTSVLLPDGRLRTLQPASVDVKSATLDRLDQVGVYHVEAGDNNMAFLAVNLDGKDSDLRPLEGVAVPKVLREHTTAASQLSRAGLGEIAFARPLLLGALLLLLTELLLAWLLGRGWG